MTDLSPSPGRWEVLGWGASRFCGFGSSFPTVQVASPCCTLACSRKLSKVSFPEEHAFKIHSRYRCVSSLFLSRALWLCWTQNSWLTVFLQHFSGTVLLSSHELVSKRKSTFYVWEPSVHRERLPLLLSGFSLSLCFLPWCLQVWISLSGSCVESSELCMWRCTFFMFSHCFSSLSTPSSTSSPSN